MVQKATRRRIDSKLGRTFIEMFAGVGLVRAGLEQAGWRCVFANDIDQEKAETYRANCKDDCLVVDDIAQITPRYIPGKVTLATASFPCQDLSVAGNRAGLDGSRSGTFWRFAELISALQNEGRKPSLIMLENVPGLLTSHNGEDVKAILVTLNEQGYLCNMGLIEAKWFVPQSRTRLFIFGVDKRAVGRPEELYEDAWTEMFWPYRMSAISESCVHPKNLLEVMKRNTGVEWFPLPALEQPGNDLTPLVSLMQPDREIPKDWWYSDDKAQRMLNRMRPEHRRQVLEAVPKRRLSVFPAYWRTREEGARLEARFDGLAGCLRTPVGGSSKQSVILAGHGKLKARLFSPREYARLQGVPEHFELPKDRNAAYMGMGDAVAVPAITWIAERILNPIADRLEQAPRSAALVPA